MHEKECCDWAIEIKSAVLNTQTLKMIDDLIEYKCLCCIMSYKKYFDENLKRQFANPNKFYIHGICKFILLLQKGVYPY